MTREGKTKNPYLAAALSVVPGLGQVYNGRWKSALLILAGAALFLILFPPAALLIWIASIWYSYATAQKVNRGEVPFVAAGLFSVAGYIIAAGILCVLVATAPSMDNYLRAERFIIDGTTRINSLPDQPGPADLPTIESARNDYLSAVALLKKIPVAPGENITRVDSYLLVATYGISACDVNSGSIEAYNHHVRMNSFVQNNDYDSARTEAVLAKEAYARMYNVSAQAGAELALVDMDALPSDLWQTVAALRSGFESAKRSKDYIALMDAYDHYFASVQYNRNAGALVQNFAITDKPLFERYMSLQRQELLQVITITDPLRMSPVPQVAEGAGKLYRASRIDLE